MFKIKIQKRAIQSITKTIEFISQDNIFYSNQVQEFIYKSIKLLEEFPLLWTDIWNWYRKIVEPNYKFKIIYKIKKENIYVVWIYREQNSWK
jgi:hypothetical protein